MKESEDKKILDIVNYLYQGAKMLAYHCPDCKVPLLKKDERIFCPSCNRDVVIVKEGEEPPETKKTEKQKEIPKVKEEKKTIEVKEENDIEKSLKITLQKLSSKLLVADDVDEIKSIIETFDKTLQILEKLKKMGI